MSGARARWYLSDGGAGTFAQTHQRTSLAEAADADGFAPNAFIRIERDGQIVLALPYVAMGQGTYTSIPPLLTPSWAVNPLFLP